MRRKGNKNTVNLREGAEGKPHAIENTWAGDTTPLVKAGIYNIYYIHGNLYSNTPNTGSAVQGRDKVHARGWGTGWEDLTRVMMWGRGGTQDFARWHTEA